VSEPDFFSESYQQKGQNFFQIDGRKTIILQSMLLDATAPLPSTLSGIPA
jgi:hypothetical protein